MLDLLLDLMGIFSGLPVEMALINMVLGFRRQVEAAKKWVWGRWPERGIQRKKISQEIAEGLHWAARGRGATNRRRNAKEKVWYKAVPQMTRKKIL